MAIRRTLGPGGPSLSQVTYGAMRLSDAPDLPEPLHVLLRLFDAGIDTHHSSHEYDSYPLYLHALGELCQTGRNVSHIVKLAEPSFDHTTFDAARLEHSVDQRLIELGTDHIAVIQWMVRTPEPAHPLVPIEVLRSQHAEMASTFDQLKASGKVGEFALFPYSPDFSRVAQAQLGPMAMCNYLSLFEDAGLDLVQAGHPLIALRPFAAASTGVQNAAEAAVVEPAPHRRHEAALRYPLLHPGVATTVVSVNQPHHIDLAIEVAHTAVADLETFDSWNTRLADRRLEVIR